MPPTGIGSDPRSHSAAGVILAGGLYLAHAALLGDYVADDAGISLAYARNLAAGFGPVLYPGGEAVEAYSNPLWTALLTAGAALGLDGADGIPLLKTLGLVCGVLTLALTAAAARAVYPDDGVVWVAPALLASLAPFAFWTASGMENGLFACLMVLTLTLQLRELRGGGAWPWSALTASALALTRPEGIAFAAAFLLHRATAGERVRQLARWAVVVAAIFGLFLAARLLVFGEWVPNTYYAKVALYGRHLRSLPGYLLDPSDRGTRYLLDAARAVWPLLALAAVGLLDRPWGRGNLLLAGLLAGSALYVVYVGGDFWPAGRFFTASLPLVALAAQHAVNLASHRHRLAGLVLAAVVTGVTLNRSLGVTAELRVLHGGDALISLQGRLDTGRRLSALTHALGLRDALIMDPDIGGLAVAGHRVLDTGGLADIHIARFHYEPTAFRSYVFAERRPDIIRTHATWTASSRVTTFPEFAARYVALQSRRDALGLHGEFIRRELVAGPRAARPASRPPSWRQAIEDGRARRSREAERARALARPAAGGGT